MADWSNPARKYEEMALDLVKMMGIRNGHIPVIKRDEHREEYALWYAYFGFRKLLASQDMMREGKDMTVPVLSPIDFDAEFNPPHPLPRVPFNGDAKNAPPDAEKRKRVELMLRRYGHWSPEPSTDKAA